MSDAAGQVTAVPQVAVVVDSLVVQPWVHDAVSAIARAQPRLVVVATGSSRRGGGSHLSHDLTAQVVDAATPEELEQAIREARIVVDLTSTRAVRARADRIVLSVRHGETLAAARGVLVRELAAGRPTVTTTVVAEGASAKRTVAAGRTALARRSLHRSRDRVAAKVPALLLRGIESALRPDRPASTVGAGERIGPIALVAGALRLAGDAVRSASTALTMTANYEVAWGERRPSDSPLRLPERMNWVDHPRDRFLADPFLARDGDTTFVFAEDYSRRDGYATIGVFEPRDPAATFRTVLDRGTHVSYPFVFRDRGSGNWLMLPETAAERRVTLFTASSFPDEWQVDTVLLDDVDAYDPTIVFRDGIYWLFFASGSSGSAPDDDLHLAFASSLRGPYTMHPLNPVKSDVIGSRPAGRLFDWNGRLIRPAQDSAREYGYAVVFQNVTELTRTGFAEEPVDRLEPDWAPLIRGTHSWDFLDDIVVTDAKRLRPKSAGARLRAARAR